MSSGHLIIVSGSFFSLALPSSPVKSSVWTTSRRSAARPRPARPLTWRTSGEGGFSQCPGSSGGPGRSRGSFALGHEPPAPLSCGERERSAADMRSPPLSCWRLSHPQHNLPDVLGDILPCKIKSCVVSAGVDHRPRAEPVAGGSKPQGAVGVGAGKRRSRADHAALPWRDAAQGRNANTHGPRRCGSNSAASWASASSWDMLAGLLTTRHPPTPSPWIGAT